MAAPRAGGGGRHQHPCAKRNSHHQLEPQTCVWALSRVARGNTGDTLIPSSVGLAVMVRMVITATGKCDQRSLAMARATHMRERGQNRTKIGWPWQTLVSPIHYPCHACADCIPMPLPSSSYAQIPNAPVRLQRV